MLQPTYGGLIPATSPNDFVLGAVETDVNVMIQNRAKPDDIVYQKNQARANRYNFTCVPTSCILAICDLYNEEITDEELNTYCELAFEAGCDPHEGWSFWEGVDFARRYWNRTRPERKVVSFRMDYNSPEYATALSYGYSLVCGYQGNWAYNKDKDDDGIVRGTAFPNPTYGHCIRKFQSSGIKVIDNYVGVVKYNIYELADPAALQESGTFYPSHYVFLKEANLTKSQVARLEGKKLKLWNGEREDSFATRKECATMCARVIKRPNPTNASDSTLAMFAGIWNGSNGEYACLRSEAQDMINRALGSNILVTFPRNTITRGEVIELLVRTMKNR